LANRYYYFRKSYPGLSNEIKVWPLRKEQSRTFPFVLPQFPKTETLNNFQLKKPLRNIWPAAITHAQILFLVPFVWKISTEARYLFRLSILFPSQSTLACDLQLLNPGASLSWNNLLAIWRFGTPKAKST
jgi:hypothetical protein